jgi:hypothetical protein
MREIQCKVHTQEYTCKQMTRNERRTTTTTTRARGKESSSFGHLSWRRTKPVLAAAATDAVTVAHVSNIQQQQEAGVR